MLDKISKNFIMLSRYSKLFTVQISVGGKSKNRVLFPNFIFAHIMTYHIEVSVFKQNFFPVRVWLIMLC